MNPLMFLCQSGLPDIKWRTIILLLKNDNILTQTISWMRCAFSEGEVFVVISEPVHKKRWAAKRIITVDQAALHHTCSLVNTGTFVGMGGSWTAPSCWKQNFTIVAHILPLVQVQENQWIQLWVVPLFFTLLQGVSQKISSPKQVSGRTSSIVECMNRRSSSGKLQFHSIYMSCKCGLSLKQTHTKNRFTQFKERCLNS